jgi:catechol 2,3-dioxygenase-like lactoylglutathione lyase family enzyme
MHNSKHQFKAGNNIAIKVPEHQFSATVSFYKDVLGFELVREEEHSVAFEFGDKVLWVDLVSTLSQSEIWLEVRSNDLEHAAKHLHEKGVVRCDQIEPLPDDFEGFWISSPANIIHLVCNN